MSINPRRTSLRSPIESVETLKTSRLNPFYCTRCGTYHDAVTPCPRFDDDVPNKYSYFYEMYNVDTNKYSRKSFRSNLEAYRIYLSSEDDTNTCDTCEKSNASTPRLKAPDIDYSPQNHCIKKCVSFDLRQPVPIYVQDKCINVSSEIDLKSLDVTQGTQTVETSDQGTDSFDNDYSIFENFGWCNFHERLHGAGVSYPYGKIILPAITEIEETQILANKNPPGPWSHEGELYRKKILKLTYPPPANEFHKGCRGKYGINKKPVPAWMGWLWNAEDCYTTSKYKVRPEWRPGAMHFRIAKMIRRHRGGYEEIEKPKRKIKKRKRDDDEDIRPMIIIMKRQGCYLITMNPVPNPYEPGSKNEDCAPIHFIVDQRKQRIEQIKEKRKCECNCECESFGEDKEVCDMSVSEDISESDDDEFELEFTPPICLVDHELLKKKHNNVDTASQTEEIVLPPKIKKGKK